MNQIIIIFYRRHSFTAEVKFNLELIRKVLCYCIKQIAGFHFAVGLFGYRSQMTSKCGMNISDPLAQRLVGHFFVSTTF